MTKRLLIIFYCNLMLTGGSLMAVNQMSGHLEQVSQWLISHVKPELELIIGSIQMRSINSYVVSDLLIRPRDNPGDECIWIERLFINVAWQPPAGLTLQSLKAESPYIKLGDTMLAALAVEDDAEAGLPKKHDQQNISLPRIEIINGSVALALSNMPEIKFRYSASPLEGGLTQLLISHPHITDHPEDAQQPQHSALAFEQILLVFDRDVFSTLQLTELTIDNPDVLITPQLLELFGVGREQTTATSGSQDARPSQQMEPDLMASPPVDWLIRKLNVNNGMIRIQDFTHDVPVIRTGVNGRFTDFSFTKEFSNNNHVLNFDDLRVATRFAPEQPFLTVADAEVVIQPAALTRQTINALRMSGAKFQMDRAFRSLVQERTSQPAVEIDEQNETAPWVISELDFSDAAISLQDLGLGIPDIGFALPAVSLQQVALSGEAQSASDTVEKIEISDFVIYSPLDPFTPVISMPTIFVEFSLAGLIRKEVNSIHIIYPTVYIGPDLFWYMEELGNQSPAAEPTNDEDLMAWKMKDFQISYGQLSIAFDRVNKISLPIPFNSRASNVNFANLEELSVNIDVEVPRQNFTFPSYQLSLNGTTGEIAYGLPLESNANNVVNTLFVENIRWRQFDAAEGWLSVTYDQQGIYGKCGCIAYDGYLEGGFSFLIREDNPWTGWLAVTDIDLESLTAILSPESVTIDSSAELAVEVSAFGPRIERVVGSMAVTSPGTLSIPKLDMMLENLPEDWDDLRRDLSKIGIQTLRDFPFESGQSNFWFIDDHGRLKLELTGTQGSRTFDIVLHDSPIQTPQLWHQTFTLQGELASGQ